MVESSSKYTRAVEAASLQDRRVRLKLSAVRAYAAPLADAIQEEGPHIAEAMRSLGLPPCKHPEARIFGGPKGWPFVIEARAHNDAEPMSVFVTVSGDVIHRSRRAELIVVAPPPDGSAYVNANLAEAHFSLGPDGGLVVRRDAVINTNHGGLYIRDAQLVVERGHAVGSTGWESYYIPISDAISEAIEKIAKREFSKRG